MERTISTDTTKRLLTVSLKKLMAQHRGVLIWQDGLLQLFRYLEKNKAICLCTLRSFGSETLRHFLWTDIHDIIHRTGMLLRYQQSPSQPGSL